MGIRQQISSSGMLFFEDIFLGTNISTPLGNLKNFLEPERMERYRSSYIDSETDGCCALAVGDCRRHRSNIAAGFVKIPARHRHRPQIAYR